MGAAELVDDALDVGEPRAGAVVDGPVRSRPISRRTESGSRCPAASMCGERRSAGGRRVGAAGEPGGLGSTTMPVTWWPTMSCSSRARSRRSLWRACSMLARRSLSRRCMYTTAAAATPSRTSIDIAMIARTGGLVSPQRDRSAATTTSAATGQRRGSRGQHGGEQHRHHDELREHPDPDPVAAQRRLGVSANDSVDATTAAATRRAATPPRQCRTQPSPRPRAPTADLRQVDGRHLPDHPQVDDRRHADDRGERDPQGHLQRGGEACEIHQEDDTDCRRRQASADRPIARSSGTGWMVDAGRRWRPHPERMDIFASILLWFGAVVGVAGALLLVAGGVAAAALDTDGIADPA